MGAVAKFTFNNKPSGRRCRKRHCHKPWFDVDYRIAKSELRLWLKANPHSHAAKHQKNKLKKFIKKEKNFLGNYKSSTYVYACEGGCALVLEKIPAKGLVVDKISVAMLLEGFHGLVGQSSPPIRLRTDHSTQVTEPPPNHTLNTNITLAELLRALKKLQRNKAASLDGMKAEFILDATELLHMPLLTMFNFFWRKAFQKRFPLKWSTRSLKEAMPPNLITTRG